MCFMYSFTVLFSIHFFSSNEFYFTFKIVQVDLGMPTMHDALGYILRTVF